MRNAYYYCIGGPLRQRRNSVLTCPPSPLACAGKTGRSLALLLTLMLFLLPVHSHSQETLQMEHGEAPHAHSSAPIPGSPEERAESEFMHQLNGVFVLLLGVLAI